MLTPTSSHPWLRSGRRPDLTCSGRAAPRAPALLLAVGLLVALGALAGCAREAIISQFAATPTPTTRPQLSGVALPRGHEASGTVGAVTTAVPTAPATTPAPTAAAPTAGPEPLVGFTAPRPAAEPSEPQRSLEAADLIAAGGALQLAGACAEAVPLYERAIALDPGFSNVYALLGLCLYDQGDVAAAAARWREALQRDPLSPDALAGLGTALYRLGQRDAGLGLYRQAVDVDPGYADETYLRVDRLWGAPALLDSRALRAALAP